MQVCYVLLIGLYSYHPTVPQASPPLRGVYWALCFLLFHAVEMCHKGKQKNLKGPRYVVLFSPITCLPHNRSLQALGASCIKFWALVWPKEQGRWEIRVVSVPRWGLFSFQSVAYCFYSPQYFVIFVALYSCHCLPCPSPNKCCLFSQLSLD